MTARKSKQKIIQEKFGMCREDLGCWLQYSMQVMCDSTPTSLAWNIINLEGINKSWKTYLDLAWEKILQCESMEEVPKALKAAAEELDYGESGRNALRLCFSLFSSQDWEGFAAYFTFADES